MRGLLLGVAAIALAACAASGVKVDEAQVRAFEKGKTGIAEVTSKLGSPTQRMVLPDGMTMLAYSYVEAQVRPETLIPYVGAFVGGTDMRTSMVMLRFDKAGVLVDYTLSESATGTGIGFASGVTEPIETQQPRKVP